MAALSATGAEQIITLEHADRVEYDERAQRAVLTGHVRVAVEGSVIEADTVVFDQTGELITAGGNLRWISATLSATGSRMTYHVRTREGEVEEVSLTAGVWLCRGERIVQRTEGEIAVEPGLITTCDLVRPHYSIRCRKIRIRLEKDLTATSVTLLVGNTPVLWLPWLVTPLREFRLPFEAQIGNTRQLGTFVRTSPAYQFTGRGPGQARLDYFSNKGFGYGLTQELLDARGDRIGRAHAYQIKETTSSGPGVPRRRWELFAEGARGFGPATRFSGQAASVSDPHVREWYGVRGLPVSVIAGERRAAALLPRALGWAAAALSAKNVPAHIEIID
ncbi:MAG: LptA/OstA family protein, partial [bacterium]